MRALSTDRMPIRAVDSATDQQRGHDRPGRRLILAPGARSSRAGEAVSLPHRLSSGPAAGCHAGSPLHGTPLLRDVGLGRLGHGLVGGAPAIIRPITSRGVCRRARCPPPSRGTSRRTRSASASTSSSSVEPSRTAVPWSRSSTIRLCRNSIAPTSTPRVGWLATSTDRGRLSSRARMTFCLLPPDRLEIGSVTDLGADVELLLRSSALRVISAQFSAGPLRERRLVAAVEDQVLRDREGGDETVHLAVLGDEPHAGHRWSRAAWRASRRRRPW